ncbi:hypothetical protein Tco_0576170, partial [Tanacetum coccineum]
ETELWNHAMVRADHAAYSDRFHELARLVPHLPKTIQKAVQIYGALTDEAVRNGSIKKVEKRGNVGEPSKDKNGRDDNKRTRTGNAFATTTNPIGRKNTSAGSFGKELSACPRLNRAQGPGGNRPNQVVANNGGQGHGNQGNQARGRAFMLGAEEAHLDLNIVTGIEPSELGFRYKIDKVIKGCKLEIKGHVFDIDLIPFGHGSFDVIIDGKVLRVLGERPEEKARLLMSAKASDKKPEKIVVVRNFPNVFSDDLSGLPPLWEIEFLIELIPGAIPVAKLPIVWHLLNWRCCRDNSRNSRIKLTVKNRYPLPRIDDLFEQLQGS